MAERVVLHIGLMKSGTSFLQKMLFSQRRQLRAHEVLVPGGSARREDVLTSHHDALRQGRTGGGPKDQWHRVLDEIREHSGTAVLSSELLAAVLNQTTKNLLPDLAPATVDIVITVRDLNRSIASMWQETIQNGHTWTWDEYYASVRETAPGTRVGEIDFHSTPGGRFWKKHDVAAIVGKLAARVGVDRVTLVTVPPPGTDRAVLPARFAEATGIPLDPDLPSPRSNDSVGLASALVLRELNEVLAAQGHPWPSGMVLRKRVLAKKGLAGISRDEPRLGIDVQDWVRQETSASIEAVQASGVRVVGSWSDLDPIPVPGVRPEDIDPAAVVRAAITGLAAVVAHQLATDR